MNPKRSELPSQVYAPQKCPVSHKVRKSEDTDLSLWRSFQNDHNVQKAFRYFYQKYSKLVFGIAFGILSDKEEAKDIVQETFMTLVEKKATINLECLKSYLLGMARNKSINRWHRKKRICPSIENDSEQDRPSLKIHNEAEFLIDWQLFNTMKKDQLSPRKYEASEYFSQGYSYQEIASKMGLSRETVKDYLKSYREFLSGFAAIA